VFIDSFEFDLSNFNPDGTLSRLSKVLNTFMGSAFWQRRSGEGKMKVLTT
jgi:hypothetical protein